MLSSALDSNGFNVQCFEEGHLAISALKAIPVAKELPLLIIVDYNMPRVNGQELLKLLKAEMPLSLVPVVMYSTTLSAVFKKAIVDMGASAAMTKAQSYQQFLTQVHEFKRLATALRILERPAEPVSLFKPFRYEPPVNAIN